MEKVRELPVKELMTKEVKFIDEDATLWEAIRRMGEENVSCFIVNKRTTHDTYGIVSRRDLIDKFVEPGVGQRNYTVGDIMNKPVVTIPPDCPVKYCAHLMKTLGYRRIPVFDGEKIIGIISNSDIIKKYADLAKGKSWKV
jgi:CBS domain-containing protein